MSKKQLITLVVMVGLLALYTGCANFATLQTPDVVEKGDGSFGFGFTYTQYQVEFFEGDDPETFNIPALALWYRYGITDRFETHANVWLPLGASVGGKFQLLGSPSETGFGFSLGLDAGYIQITSGNSKTSIVDVYVPVYLGVDFTEAVGIYLVPKYIARIYIGDTCE